MAAAPLSLLPRVAPLALALLAALGCGREAGFPERTSILLITIDTLRADHLSSYGYPRETSPVLDRLAAEGVRFEAAAVQWPKTGPSFASLFTATYPKNNGIVRKVGATVPLEFRMLAEELRERGYSTHAVVANGAVASDFNFDQGFDTFIETWKLEPGPGGGDPSRADSVTELAVGILERLETDRPFFLWVHYLDPHFPYEPPPPWRDRFQGDEWFDGEERVPIDPTRAKRDLASIGFGQVLDERDELAFYRARYDAEIAYNDSEVGRLLEAAAAGGRLERTLTVVTSDHGESLGEHGYYFDHGRFGFETCLRVPLIFHYPGVLAPRVDPDPAALVHLAPTLLEAAGAELADGSWMQGRSLAPRLFGQGPPGETARYAFSEAGYGRLDMWQRIVRSGRFKLVDAQEGHDQRWITGALGDRYALFDLEADPGESTNAIAGFPEEAEALRQVLDRWYAAPFDARVDEAGEAAERGMDEETRKHLEALGYLQ